MQTQTSSPFTSHIFGQTRMNPVYRSGDKWGDLKWAEGWRGRNSLVLFLSCSKYTSTDFSQLLKIYRHWFFSDDTFVFSGMPPGYLTSKITESSIRDGWRHQNGWIFGKVPGEGGEGVIFNPKIYVADFGPLNRAFSAWKWYKRAFSGYVFNQLPCWTVVLHASHGK